MTVDDKSESSGSSDGTSGSNTLILQRCCAGSSNIRARAGLYMKDGHKLKGDFHALYRSTCESR